MVDLCENYLDTWLQLVAAKQPATAAAARAAKHIATCAGCQARLRQLWQALDSPQEDTLSCADAAMPLLDHIEAQVTGRAPARNHSLQNHLSLCPSCLATYADILARRMATRHDLVPVAQVYPAFDLTFLRQGGRQSPAAERFAPNTLFQPVQRAMAGVRIRLGELLNEQMQAALVLRSSDLEKPMWSVLYEAEDESGWEAEMTVYADGEAFCRLEVAIYRAGATEQDLLAVPVILRYGESEQLATTVAGGKVFFPNLPRQQVANCELILPA